MTITRIAFTFFTLTVFADTLFGLRDCVYWDRWCNAENNAEIAQHNREAMDRLAREKAELNRKIAEARAQFFQLYPDRPGVAEAEAKFTRQSPGSRPFRRVC